MNNYRDFYNDIKDLCYDNNDEMIICANLDSPKSYSYEDVWRLIKRCNAFFYEVGLKSGDTIATILPNSIEAVICFFAASIAGINYAPLPCTVSEREYDNWNTLINPVLYITKKGVVQFKTDKEFRQIEDDGNFAWLPEKEYDFKKSLCQSKVYLLTSGTTGTPKAMQIDINKLWSAGYAFCQEYNILDSKIRFWNYLPMSYLGGLFNLAMIPLCCKGSFVISETFSGKTMLNFWGFVKQYDITAIWFVPSIVRGLLKISKLIGVKYMETYKKIQVAFLGTAPIDLIVKEEFERTFGIRLYENFALSETTFLTGEKDNNIRFREQKSVGEELSYVELELRSIDATNNICEIWVKTPYLFDGYLDSCGVLGYEIDDKGFFNSKDLGYLNDDGQLVLAGRSRDIIKKGGLFVSLVEIENVVIERELIDEVAAVPISHEFYGESYILCVIFKGVEDEEREIEKLKAWMMDRFVPYKLPDKIVAMKEFPRTASGKIIKNDIVKEIMRG
ncbi:MAG: acyl--CoA ligase [Lachnospiraceae bacterium]|nr:acyl--CoA ligase [Lachnospiraceae bacterium]